jgi:hypothetical protein
MVFDMKTYGFVGTCVESFDKDTMEYIAGNAFFDINDFAVVDKMLENFSCDKSHLSKINGYLPEITIEDTFSFIPNRNIYIIYIARQDIHYFYE